jgi:hypothetical protein
MNTIQPIVWVALAYPCGLGLRGHFRSMAEGLKLAQPHSDRR